MQVSEASDNSQGAKISPQIDEARVQGLISFKNSSSSSRRRRHRHRGDSCS